MNFTINLHDYSHNEYISNFILEHKCWESIHSELLIEILRKEENIVFVDVGANIGWFTLLAASFNKRVVSFEPVEENIILLAKSVSQNNYSSLVKSYKVALGKQESEITLKLYKYNMGLCSFREEEGNMNSYKEVIVPVRKFDSYFEGNTEYLVVKIDVEHMELDVLKGMSVSFNTGRVKYLFIELLNNHREILDILRNNGFERAINIGFGKKGGEFIDFDTNHLIGKNYQQLDEIGYSINRQLLLIHNSVS